MSAEILFNKTGGRLTGRSVMKLESEQIKLEKAGAETIPKNENDSAKTQGSATAETKSSLARSLDRKIDYNIQLENNEIIIQVRDGETGKVIRQIPQEDFVRMTDRISEVNKSILNEIV